MPTSYPGAIDSFTNPTSGDQLSSPSHADQHADANDAIEAIQTELDRVKNLGIIELSLSGNQVISGSETLLFTQIVREDDPNGDLTPNLTTGVVTVNNAGWYEIHAGARQLESDTSGERLFRIIAGGSTIVEDRRSGSAQGTIGISRKVYLTAAQTIEVAYQETSASDITIQDVSNTFLVIERVK